MKTKQGSIELSTSTFVVIITCLSLTLVGLITLFLWTGGLDSVGRDVDGSLEEMSINSPTLQDFPVKSVTSLTPPTILPPSKFLTNCLQNFSCDTYFIYLPLGAWQNQTAFEMKANERAAFFIDISGFKFREVGVIVMPFNVSWKCNLGRFNSKLAGDHARLKKCADNYADSLGVDYERAIALSPAFDGGRAFFRSKVLYASMGYTIEQQAQEAPSIVAHEMGHTYSLCDEYSLITYTSQNRYFSRNTCMNTFPSHCQKNETKCLGNTPPYRDYTGESLAKVCEGRTHYSVMGASSGAECGYDKTGGYTAVGGLS